MSAKRKLSTVEQSDESSQRRIPRQDPVSCQSCRKKKLKCDRLQQCSNCRSRRISCHYAIANVAHQYAPPPLAALAASSSTNTTIATTTAGARPGTASVVDKATTQHVASKVTHTEEHQLPSQAITEHERTAGWLENILMGPRVPDALPASLRTKSIASKRAAISATNLTAFLPREAESFAQFQYYLEHVGYLYHVIIPSRTQSQINAIYQSMHEEGSPTAAAVDLNHLAVLFSILAASSYFQNIGANAVVAKQAEKRCHEYTSLVAAALTQSDYMNYPTTEGLQAALIVSQYLPNNGQDSAVRALFHMGALVNQCRQMGLFLLDSAQSKAHRKKHGFDPVELELKRRLAWSVASTDWFLAYLGGPQEGSYLVQPAHMAIDMVANISDEDLLNSEPSSESMPDHIPTTMSYFIHRVKVSEFCREIVDYTGRERLQGIDPPYSKIMELDQKWKQYAQTLPDFFRMDSTNRRKYAQLFEKSPQMAWQRLLIQQGYHSRLCRLHRGYFIRGARDPAYSYSHIMCLQAARRVLEIKRIMDEEFPNAPSISLAWSVIHHSFMAAIILLMDVCFNWDDILADRRKQEVMEACRMLDKARRSSTLVNEGISAMMEILQSRWRSGASDSSPPPPQGEHSHSTSLPNSLEVQQQGQEIDYYPRQETETNIDGRNNGKVPSTALYPSLDAGTDASFGLNATADDTRDLEILWSEFLESGAMVAASPNEWMGLLSDLTDGAPTL